MRWAPRCSSSQYHSTPMVRTTCINYLLTVDIVPVVDAKTGEAYLRIVHYWCKEYTTSQLLYSVQVCVCVCVGCVWCAVYV